MATAETVYGMAQYQEMVKASWECIRLPFFVLRTARNLLRVAGNNLSSPKSNDAKRRAWNENL